MKEIKKIQDKMPTDPYEAELLLMAEMVADDAKKDSDSDSDDDRPLKTLINSSSLGVAAYHEVESHGVGAHATVGGTGMEGEDMLMMALKMAYDEPAADLEASMTANTITQAPHEVHHQQYDQYGMAQHVHQDAYGMSIGHHHQQSQGHNLLLLESAHQLQQQQQQIQAEVQPVSRGRKRGSGRGGAAGRAVAQPAQTVIQPPASKRGRNRSPQTTYQEQPVVVEKNDSNMCLKVGQVMRD